MPPDSDAPLDEHDAHVAIEDVVDSLVVYGRGTPRLLKMLLTAIRETLVVYQQQEAERVELLERMWRPEKPGST